MDVLIAGGHGKVARHLIRRLAADGHTARGIIRNPDHAADVEADGGIAVVCDLEREDSDAVRRTAWTRSCSPPAPAPARAPSASARSTTARPSSASTAAQAAGVARFVIVSSIGAHDPEGGIEAMRPYLRAKAEADAHVAASGLDWTIVRPGSLTDDPGTGLVDVTTTPGGRGPVPRDDVALVLLETLLAPAAVHQTFEVFAGDVPAREAVRSLSPLPDV